MIVNPIVIDMDVGTPTQIPMSVESTQTTIGMGFDEAINVVVRGRVQEKEVTPTEEVQSVLPDEDYDALSKVTVDAIPSDYVGSDIPLNDSSDLSVSGGTVSVPNGFYREDASASVQSAVHNSPSINISASGLITSTHAQSEGYVQNDTSSATYQMNTVNGTSVTPTEYPITVAQTHAYTLGAIDVKAIPSDYVGSSIVRRDESDLTVSGGTVQVPSGFYEENESKSIPSGSASTPNTSITANPSISVSSSGLITASVSESESVTPNVTAGYVSSGTAGTISVSGSETKQLPNRTSADLTVSGATVTALAGWYENNASKSVASGTEGTPTATKGTVSNHSVSVTPSVTNTEGFINGGTHNGSSVTVSASELVSGTKNISQNGESDVTNYQKVNVSVPIPTPSLQTKTKTYTPTTSQQAETVIADAGYDGLDEVDITVNPIPPEYIVPSGTYTVSASGTADITNYANLSVPSGSAGSPALSVSEVTNHSVTVRASTIRTAGWIPGGTVQGASRVISASDLVSGTKSITSNGTGIDVTNYETVDVSVPSGQPTLQTKSVSYTPTTSQQTASVTADVGYDGLDEVDITVDAMPSGSASAPSTISGTSASVSTGTNTLTLSKTVSVTPTVSAGYVSSGTATNSSVSLTASVTTKGATNHYATTSDQTIASGTYLTGTQTIKALSQTNLSAENIKSGTTITINNGNANVWSVLGTYTGGGGGTDRLVLLQTTSLGALSTSSTSATNTNKTVTLASSTNWDDYDLLIVDISVDSITNNRHTSSVSFVINTGTSNVSTKNTYTVGSNVWNSRLSSSGTASSRQSTSKYGIYVNSASVSSSTLSLPIYYRYNSNNTGTINGNYTARVYGIVLIDLIGG